MTSPRGRALVLGAAGFAGRHIARELSRNGWEVVGAGRHEPASPVEGAAAWVPCDVSDAASVRAALGSVAPAAVAVLAGASSVAASWGDPADCLSANACGAANVLEAARALPAPPRVLLVGSSEEYAPSGRPLSEGCPLGPASPYGVSKVSQELLGRAYAARYGLPVYLARPFNHTGAGQDPRFAVPGWCAQVAAARASGAPCVVRAGDTGLARDFADVRDVVRGYRLLLESDAVAEPVNFCSGRAHRLGDLIGLIAEAAGAEVSVEEDPALMRAGEPRTIEGDRSKAAGLLGWEPEFDIEQTLRWTYGSLAGKG